MGRRGQVPGTFGVGAGQGCACFLAPWDLHTLSSAWWEVLAAFRGGILPAAVPHPPPNPKSPAGSAQESWMWWLGVGGLAVGLPDLKGPVPGPLSVALHTAPLARGLAGLGACICLLNISPEPEFGPGGAWPSTAASPGCPSPCPSWRGAWERLLPPLQPSPWAPTLCIPCPAPPPARLPGTRGPWRFLDQIELPGWFFPFCFFFWPSRVGEPGEEPVIGPAPAEGGGSPWLPRWKCDPQPLPLSAWGAWLPLLARTSRFGVSCLLPFVLQQEAPGGMRGPSSCSPW